MNETFDEHCKTGIYNLKLHLLAHILEDLGKFGLLDVVNSSLLDLYNVHSKMVYRATSK